MQRKLLKILLAVSIAMSGAGISVFAGISESSAQINATNIIILSAASASAQQRNREQNQRQKEYRKNLQLHYSAGLMPMLQFIMASGRNCSKQEAAADICMTASELSGVGYDHDRNKAESCLLEALMAGTSIEQVCSDWNDYNADRYVSPIAFAFAAFLGICVFVFLGSVLFCVFRD